MSRSIRRAVLVAGVVAALASAGVPSSAAPSDTARHAKPRTVHVSGHQIFVQQYPDRSIEYRMDGDLVGRWLYRPTPGDPLHDVPSLYIESALEDFRGCIDRNRDGDCADRRDLRGELHSVSLYWASFDRSGALVKGQCVHPVTGGRGAFTGARGLIGMVDTPRNGEVVTTYSGEIVLHGADEQATAPTTFPATAPAGTARALVSAAHQGC